MDNHAKEIADALTAVEQTHRAHGRAIAVLHKVLAAAATEVGPSIGLGDEFVAFAAAPKKPPEN